MNFKRQAEKLESYLSEEFKQKLPIAVLPNGALVYENFIVKKTKANQWDLYQNKGFKVGTFNLKACALMAAKCYSKNKLTEYNEIVNLDQYYQRNATDSDIFKYRYDNSKDSTRKDLALWRWEITTARARTSKEQIALRFRRMF
jgi:hypothetical protein